MNDAVRLSLAGPRFQELFVTLAALLKAEVQLEKCFSVFFPVKYIKVRSVKSLWDCGSFFDIQVRTIRVVAVRLETHLHHTVNSKAHVNRGEKKYISAGRKTERNVYFSLGCLSASVCQRSIVFLVVTFLSYKNLSRKMKG